MAMNTGQMQNLQDHLRSYREIESFEPEVVEEGIFIPNEGFYGRTWRIAVRIRGYAPTVYINSWQEWQAVRGTFATS